MDHVGAAEIARTPARTVLVRHGATEWSRDGRHTGRTDLPLLVAGEDAARHLHVKLAEVTGPSGPRLVLSSPLTRARETCRLAGYDAQVVVHDDLVEWDYGAYEGRTTSEIHEERRGWDLFKDGCPGGEAIGDVARRVSRVIAQLRSDPLLTDGAAMLFAHGHVLRVFAAVWADLGPDAARALPLDTAKLGVLGWSHADPAIEAWNL